MATFKWQKRLSALDRVDMEALKRSRRDPDDLEKKVKDFQEWLADKKAGKLPMMERIG